MCELQLVIEMFLGGRAAPGVELNLGEMGQRTNIVRSKTLADFGNLG